MKTKFILYGGFNPAETKPNNSAFSKEILKDAPENAKVLVVPFAKEIDRILPTLERVSLELNENKSQENIIIESATEDSFIKQLEWADVIYFQGGSTAKLLETLKQFPNLDQFLVNKTVAGDSAGGNVLCAYFYTPRTDSVSEGLGVLPVKMIPHFKQEYKDRFNDVAGELEAVLLPEYSYRVIYK